MMLKCASVKFFWLIVFYTLLLTTIVNQMAVIKAPLGIFWDIENCSVPKSFVNNAYGLAKIIRDFIAGKHPECGYAEDFVCVCDVTKIDKRVREGLNKNGLNLIDVPNTAKNAADDKLKELIEKFIDRYRDRGEAVICLITGDINFSSSIRNALHKNLNVVLIHSTSHSRDLKNLVKESYFFDDIISGGHIDVIPDEPAKPGQYNHIYNFQLILTFQFIACLLVSNLPSNKPFGDLKRRLSQLSDNCGGKPELFNGKAVIKFGCIEDAERCLQRINGDDVYGNKIVVTLANEDVMKTSKKRGKNNNLKKASNNLALKAKPKNDMRSDKVCDQRNGDQKERKRLPKSSTVSEGLE